MKRIMTVTVTAVMQPEDMMKRMKTNCCQYSDAAQETLSDTTNQAGWQSGLVSSGVMERVHCYKCFVSTHEHDYTQYFYNVMAKGIGDQEARLPGQPLGHTLRELESHSLKSCDHEKGMVWGQEVPHCLVSHPPKVFTMQLAWQTDSESKLDIKAAMMGLREGLDLADVYLGIAHGCFLYHIRSVVCYMECHGSAHGI
ncbi:MAG: hypothetical protein FRX49_03900 [Trebouxia sp. A1-2]|nr:MAG: hypothetical protein FRX49_03900 [Trebouxia sp. A1-2]